MKIVNAFQIPESEDGRKFITQVHTRCMRMSMSWQR